MSFSDIAGTLVRDCADPATANRPFDQGRSGFLFSQGGAAMLVLEDITREKRVRTTMARYMAKEVVDRLLA